MGDADKYNVFFAVYSIFNLIFVATKANNNKNKTMKNQILLSTALLGVALVCGCSSQPVVEYANDTTLEPHQLCPIHHPS